MAAHFVVVGGGLTGLSAAFALARSGHKVTVLEKDNFDYDSDGGVCRMSPNMSKIFFQWGYEDRLRQIAVKSNYTIFTGYNNNEILGSHTWDEEYLFETGGDFIFAHNADLRRLVFELAAQAGATIRSKTEAKSIDMVTNQVTLASGETISADAFIGADGLHGICRKAVLNGQPDKVKPTGLVMYNGLASGKEVRADPELAKMWESPNLYVSCGNLRAALQFPLGGTDDYAIQVAIGDARPAVRKCVSMATRITKLPVEDRAHIEDWIHEDGPLLLLGGAAHPYPPGAIQTGGVSLEDAGLLGKLFSHLSSADQIPSFLYAFQDLREKRCRDIQQQELNIVQLITLPDGPHQQGRDAKMKTNYAKGLSVFHGDEGELAEQWEVNRITFTYDPEDDADNWWIQWGALRERSKNNPTESKPIEIPVQQVGVYV